MTRPRLVPSRDSPQPDSQPPPPTQQPPPTQPPPPTQQPPPTQPPPPTQRDSSGRQQCLHQVKKQLKNKNKVFHVYQSDPSDPCGLFSLFSPNPNTVRDMVEEVLKAPDTAYCGPKGILSQFPDFERILVDRSRFEDIGVLFSVKMVEEVQKAPDTAYCGPNISHSDKRKMREIAKGILSRFPDLERILAKRILVGRPRFEDIGWLFSVMSVLQGQFSDCEYQMLISLLNGAVFKLFGPN